MDSGNVRREHGDVSRRNLLTGVGGATAMIIAGSTAGKAQSAEPTERWRYSPGSTSNLIGHDGTYYLTAGESIQAIDATSGEVTWTASAGGSVLEDSFAVDTTTGTVIVANETGSAIGVNIDGGDERWRRSIGGAGLGVSVANGTAYLLSESSVDAVDIGSGDQTWTHTISGVVNTAGSQRGIAVAATNNGVIPVYHTDRYLVGLNGSGNDQWRVEPSTPAFNDRLFRFNHNNIVSQGQYVYFQGDTGPSDGDPHGMVDAAAGELIWERLDEYTNLSELRGGPGTFQGNIVNSGTEATVLSVPGGRKQWSSGLTTYDGIRGTSKALYISGNAGDTAVVRSFGSDGTVNWTLEFGAYEGYDQIYNEGYQFYNVPPAVTDGSILFGVVPENGDPALRCYQLPEPEWLAEPQRESTPTTTANTVTTGASASTQTTKTPVNTGADTAATSDSGDSKPTRGFFTNGQNRPLSGLGGFDLTVFSTIITVLGIVVTIYDLIQGGGN